VRPAAWLVALACAAAGCGGDDAPGPRVQLPPEPQGSEPNKGSPGAQEASGGKIDVPIRDGAFVAPVMRLGIGQTVVFTNDDDVPHAVWNDDEPRLPRSGEIPVGGRYEFQPKEPGRIGYHDPLYPEMTGTLIVAEQPASPTQRGPGRRSCSEASERDRHEIGDLEGDMRRDTRCR
jgi:plastocyanin